MLADQRKRDAEARRRGVCDDDLQQSVWGGQQGRRGQSSIEARDPEQLKVERRVAHGPWVLGFFTVLNRDALHVAAALRGPEGLPRSHHRHVIL